ncbi:MAG: esterase [Phycisphaerae bacterium]|nr:esterase [Phycisphaerae bacterium]
MRDLHRSLPLTLLIIALAAHVAAETRPVQFVVITPDRAADQPPRIFLSSSADNWNEQGRPLDKIAPGVYSATFNFDAGVTLEYKFTRAGSWSTVEKAANADERPNRALLVDADAAEHTVVDIVARWADRVPPDDRRILAGERPASSEPASRPSTLTGTIRYHHLFHSPQLHNDRTLIVYLPPGYDDHPDQRYPVLYLHDGNNVFDARTSFLGSAWRADETAERLIREQRMPPLIIVGIYNTPERMDEYTPFRDEQRGGGQGDTYLAFIVETVKPYIDQTYRTRPEREHTAIGGSSLGGLISLYAAYRYPDVFKCAAAISPTLPWADGAVLRYIAEHKPAQPPKIWLDMGTEESIGDADNASPFLAACDKAVEAFKAAGLRPDVDFHYEKVSGGRHNEDAWARRFDQVLLFLYGQPQR